MLGLVLAYTNSTGDWPFWAYAWALVVPGGIGLGMYLQGITFDVPPDLKRLPRLAEVALFRVLQESLTNVHRHSQSATAHVRLFEENGWAVLEIEDQGKGFPAAIFDVDNGDSPSTFGVGLRGMKERLRDLGGTIELKRAKEQGAVVRASVPRKEERVLENRESTPEKQNSAA